MGRYPTPVETLRARGSWVPPGREGEASTPHGIPQMPSMISKAGALHWEPMVRTLDDMGVLARADALSLMLLCDMLGTYLTLRDYQSNDPELQAKMQVYAMRAWEKLQDALKKFGLSPLDRMGLRIQKKAADKAEMSEEDQDKLRILGKTA